MNINRLAVYHEQTGAIHHIVELGDDLIQEIYLNLPDFHLAVEVPSEVEPWSHYVDVENDDAPALYPPKPCEACQWIGQEWFDPRTPSEVVADRRAIREQARRTKSELLTTLMAENVLSPEQVVQATTGIPASLHEGLVALPQDVQAYIFAEWMTRTEFGRMDQVVAIAGAALGLTDEDLDHIFGVSL